MSNFAAMPDIHIHPTRYGYMAPSLNWAAKQISERTARCVVPGDIYHKDVIGDSTHTPGEVIDFAKEQLFYHEDSRTEWDLLDGNHDREEFNRGSALLCMKDMRNINVYFLPTVVGIGRALLYMMPWAHRGHEEVTMRAVENMVNAHRDQDERSGFPRAHILCAHVRVLDIELPDGSEYSEDKAEGFMVRPEWIDNHFDYCLLGDFHKRQEVIPGKGGYVGSLTQHTFKEEGYESGIEIVTIDEATLEISTEWLENPFARKHFTHEVTNLEEVHRIIDQRGLGTDFNRVKIKYMIDHTEESRQLWQQIQELCDKHSYIAKSSHAPVKLVELSVDVDTITGDDPEQAMDLWIDATKPTDQEQKDLWFGLGKIQGKDYSSKIDTVSKEPANAAS